MLLNSNNIVFVTRKIPFICCSLTLIIKFQNSNFFSFFLRIAIRRKLKQTKSLRQMGDEGMIIRLNNINEKYTEHFTIIILYTHQFWSRFRCGASSSNRCFVTLLKRRKPNEFRSFDYQNITFHVFIEGHLSILGILFA